MNFNKEMAALEKAAFTKKVCSACTSPLLIPKGADGSFCHLCEFYNINSNSKAAKPEDALQSAVAEATTSLANGDWGALTSALEPFAQSANPATLYGLGSIYKSLSDYVYSDVNYSLSGFMHRNADNRNDEPNRNKHNSMALGSKAKGLFFATLYLIGKMTEKEREDWLFTEFMAEIKLKRYPKAGKVSMTMQSADKTGAIHDYESMVYAVERHEQSAKYILSTLSQGHLNSLYYLARRLIRNGDYKAAGRSLSLMLEKTASPMASKLLAGLENLEAETRL